MPAAKEQPHGYDDRNPKIDIFAGGKYVASTNWSKTCKQAVAYYCKTHPDAVGVTAELSK